jgi:hypothetical protein
MFYDSSISPLSMSGSVVVISEVAPFIYFMASDIEYIEAILITIPYYGHEEFTNTARWRNLPCYV